MRGALYGILLMLFSFCASVCNAQIITTFAGNGFAGYSGDGGAATSAQMKSSDNVIPDTSGNVFIIDQGNYVIRKVNALGVITTVAGNGTVGCSGDGGPALTAQFKAIRGACLDGVGNLIIADPPCHCIRKINSIGTIVTIAGTGVAGFSGDGGAATAAQFDNPIFAATDDTGNIFISDRQNYRIRKINLAGIVTTIAGNGTPTYMGGGGAATREGVYPWYLYIKNNNIYLSLGNRLCKIDAAGIITTIAGNGTIGFSGDGGPATAAQLNSPRGITIDTLGNIYFADGANYRIRKINSVGIITTIAGNGLMSHAGDGGPATAASFGGVLHGISLSKNGQLYITDAGSNRVRRLDNITDVDDVSNTHFILKPLPNPVHDILTVDIPMDGNYAVTNMLGQKVIEGTIKKGISNIDAHLLNDGFFIFSVSNECESNKCIFVKQ